MGFGFEVASFAMPSSAPRLQFPGQRLVPTSSRGKFSVAQFADTAWLLKLPLLTFWIVAVVNLGSRRRYLFSVGEQIRMWNEMVIQGAYPTHWNRFKVLWYSAFSTLGDALFSWHVASVARPFSVQKIDEL
ncbi:hypothetical protein DVH05_005034 [Phytophthora capsici]|nr:hypothetical protein DVH05_005034 [Phytophthora capsici]